MSRLAARPVISSLLLFAMVSSAAAACTEAGDAPISSPSPTPTATAEADTRIVYPDVGSSWMGRDYYAVCIQDTTKSV